MLGATDIQRSFRGEPIVTDDPAAPLAVRIGIHTGQAEYVEREGKPDYDGHAVNIAARVESLLKDGERIYCSGETKALAKTGPGVRFHSYGPYVLKGVSSKVEIFDVLRDDAMQPASPEQPHDTLPYPWLTTWVGREREMTELAEALSASRLATLHGTGGVGKTRMAVETLLSRGGGLPREIIFVSLDRADDTPEGLLIAIREAAGLTEVEAPDLEALCRHLHGGDRLLLLDNFESVMNAAASTQRLATTPGVRVLVTSQRALDVKGERVVELDPMETKGDPARLESYRLFIGLAQQRDARWQPDDDAAMRDVLVATDGLPYLIELVAAVAPKRKLRQLADELKTRVQEVRARGANAELAGRHAGVQACLEWVLGRLPAEEREALPRLAVFTSGFDAEAAEGVTNTTIGSLDVLVDASLLRFENLTKAVTCYEAALRVSTERDFPVDWAMTQNNLGAAYANLPTDEPSQNLMKAIACYEAALRVRTERDFPYVWANTQYNLGSVYEKLSDSEPNDYRHQAILCFEAAARGYLAVGATDKTEKALQHAARLAAESS